MDRAAPGVLECVANVSEGRDPGVIEALAVAAEPVLLDVHSDADHHRSVLTFAGDPAAVEDAARRLAGACVERIDLSSHDGVHPRLGALDVVPFVALDSRDAGVAVGAARDFAAWLADAHAVPTFLYDQADPQGRSLPETRRDAFGPRLPDFGPHQPHATAGATAVGARPPLVAVNCELATGDVEVARAVAEAVRGRDGGLPGVRALGFGLPARARAQVSMNLVDLGATGLEAACTAVRLRAAEAGTEVARVELVGLVPVAELERCGDEFRAWAGLSASQTIEARLAAREAAF